MVQHLANHFMIGVHCQMTDDYNHVTNDDNSTKCFTYSTYFSVIQKKLLQDSFEADYYMQYSLFKTNTVSKISPCICHIFAFKMWMLLFNTFVSDLLKEYCPELYIVKNYGLFVPDSMGLATAILMQHSPKPTVSGEETLTNSHNGP